MTDLTLSELIELELKEGRLISHISNFLQFSVSAANETSSENSFPGFIVCLWQPSPGPGLSYCWKKLRLPLLSLHTLEPRRETVSEEEMERKRERERECLCVREREREQEKRERERKREVISFDRLICIG
jgi:hypothetical protein